jgi:hypothetical protein
LVFQENIFKYLGDDGRYGDAPVVSLRTVQVG